MWYCTNLLVCNRTGKRIVWNKYQLYDNAVCFSYDLHCQWNLAGAGWASILYTAALSNASQELKEAAVIDGANIFQQIKAVEWPAIKDIVLIQLIMQVGNILSIGFEKAYALQTDLNLPTSEIISTYVYKKGLIDGDYGFSTAVGLFNTVINVILLIAVNKIVKKMNDGKGI